MVVYSRSAALEAYLEWERHRPRAEALLKRYNGRGLPAGYELEADPARWDLFDLVVLSLAWGPSRVGLQLDEERFLETFAQFVYSSGGTEDELVRGKGPGVRNAHYWLRFFEDSGTIRRYDRSQELVEQLARGEAARAIEALLERFTEARSARR